MRLITVLIFFALLSCSTDKRELPIFGRSEIKENNNNGIITFDTINHYIKKFEFYNQDSVLIDNNTFNNSLYVADFFFTTCPTICPIMKNNLIKVYDRFLSNEKVKYLSHTINPEYDNVKILKNFSERLNVDSKIWHFVTGDIDDIYKTAKSSYMVSALKDENEPGGFLHSGTFLLVDHNRNIRGIYEGTDESEINRLIEDIEILLINIP
ncbi:MAG: SCO family protein [Flammeovirgaceae bacterium]